MDFDVLVGVGGKVDCEVVWEVGEGEGDGCFDVFFVVRVFWVVLAFVVMVIGMFFQDVSGLGMGMGMGVGVGVRLRGRGNGGVVRMRRVWG